MSNTKVTLAYTGTIYAGMQDPSPLFRLLSRLRANGRISSERVELLVASRNPGDLLQIVAREGVGDFVRFLGPVSRRESVALQNQADVLVLLDFGGGEVKGILTGKVFEYLATNKPILLIGTSEASELFKLLSSHGRLIGIDTLESVLTGASDLPRCEAVDYTEISRNQLRVAMEGLRAS